MISKHRTAGRIAAWTAVATLGVGAVAGIALAAPSTTPSPSGGSASSADSAKHAGHQKGDHKGVKQLGKRMLHGEFVAKGKDGAYVTVDTQRGLLTQVSSTSITVKSADGFTTTYVVSPETKVRKDGKTATIGDLKAGDPAMVIAIKSGDSTTAKGVVVRAPKDTKSN